MRLSIERLSVQELLGLNPSFRETWEARIRLEAENASLKYPLYFFYKELAHAKGRQTLNLLISSGSYSQAGGYTNSVVT